MKTTTPAYLLQQTNFDKAIVVVYDAPAETPFNDIVELKKEGHVCLFAHYKNWMKGKTLRMTTNLWANGSTGPKGTSPNTMLFLWGRLTKNLWSMPNYFSAGRVHTKYLSHATHHKKLVVVVEWR